MSDNLKKLSSKAFIKSTTGQTLNAAWYGWFDMSLVSSVSGAGVLTPAADSVFTQACIVGSSKIA